jgi:hypothetical protein
MLVIYLREEGVEDLEIPRRMNEFGAIDLEVLEEVLEEVLQFN